MWSAIVDVAGWALFYFVLILFVRWTAIERAFFAGQNPEGWEPERAAAPVPPDLRDPTPAAQLPFTSSSSLTMPT